MRGRRRADLTRRKLRTYHESEDDEALGEEKEDREGKNEAETSLKARFFELAEERLAVLERGP